VAQLDACLVNHPTSLGNFTAAPESPAHAKSHRDSIIYQRTLRSHLPCSADEV